MNPEQRDQAKLQAKRLRELSFALSDALIKSEDDRVGVLLYEIKGIVDQLEGTIA
jgi:hypothetical protein